MKPDYRTIPTEVEPRAGDAGFIYVGNTRLGFSPAYITDHEEKVEGQNDHLTLWFARHWPRPTQSEIHAARLALENAYPGRVK